VNAIPPQLGVVGLAVLGILGVVVTVWVYRPAFQGPEAARRHLGTHRLAFGSLVSVLVLNTLLTLPLAPLLRVDRGFTLVSFVVAALSTQIPMVIFVYVRLIRSGAVTWAELGVRPLPVSRVLSVGVAGGVGGLLLTAVVGAALAQFGLQSNQLQQFTFAVAEGPMAFIVLLVAAGLVAPIVEELFFRGFLFGLYRRRQPLWVAYVVSSALFTLLHVEPTRMNPAQIVGLSVGVFMLAVLLAWLYQRTGSLFPSMVAHAVNNMTGLILFYLASTRGLPIP
jgi:membrane protease YdiL (CAAX protease family)